MFVGKKRDSASSLPLDLRMNITVLEHGDCSFLRTSRTCTFPCVFALTHSSAHFDRAHSTRTQGQDKENRTPHTMAVIEEIIEDAHVKTPSQTETSSSSQDTATKKINDLDITAPLEKLELSEDDVRMADSHVPSRYKGSSSGTISQT